MESVNEVLAQQTWKLRLKEGSFVYGRSVLVFGVH